MTNQQLSIDTVKSLVNERIKSVISRRIEQADGIHPAYLKFWQHILNTALAGGKRMRAYLTVVGYGEIDDDILSVATAHELLHIAMYIHDDVIDGDLVRHGQKNFGGSYLDEYKDLAPAAEVAHYANSAAILAGDALLSEAYQLINSTNFASDIKERLSRQLGNSIFEVIGGELLDVEASFIKLMEVDPITVYRYKTASYSTVGPLMAGAFCSRRSDESLSQLADAATNIGIAFQIQDDLLGVFGDELESGKSTIGDLREGKKTLLINKHMVNMNDAQMRRFEMYFGNNQADDAVFIELKKDIVDSGAKQETEEYIAMYFDKAKSQIDELPDQKLADRLISLIKILSSRSQ